jgi:hypothetical protein
MGMSLAGKNHTIYAYSGTEIDCSNNYTNTGVNFSGLYNTTLKHNLNANGGVGGNAVNFNTVYNFMCQDITAKWCVSSAITTSVVNVTNMGNLDFSYGTWGGLNLGSGVNGTLQYILSGNIKSLTALTNGTGFGNYGNTGFTFIGCNDLNIYGGQINGGYYAGIDLSGSIVNFKNFTNTNTVPFRYSNTGTNDGSMAFCEADDGTIGTNNIYSQIGLIVNDTTIRHTTSGYSLKASPTTIYASENSPLELSLGLFPVTGGVSNTIYAWMYRDNIGITNKLILKAKDIDGVTTDVSSSMTAAAGNWEQVSITFTPTISGVVKVYWQTYGGTTYNAWIDDVNGDLTENQYFARPVYLPDSAGGEVSYAWC